MRAAVAALRTLGASRLVVAVPVAAPQMCAALGAEVDEIVCAHTPEPFDAVGPCYADFTPTTDAEVHDLLAQAWQGDATEAAGRTPGETADGRS